MKSALARCFVIGSALLAVSGVASAQGLIDPFGRDAVEVSPADWTLIKESTRKVLESGKAGSAATWKNPDGSRAGRSKLLRVFKRNNMPCGEVEHAFTAGGGRRYVLPFCKVQDGSWKVAF